MTENSRITANASTTTPKLRLVSLADLDGRTRAARCVRDLTADVIADLGGEAEVSAMQRQVVQRVAVCGAMLESIEAGWAAGKDIDEGGYVTLLNAQRRLVHTLGLARKARHVPQDLQSYLASKDRERGTSQPLD